MSVRAHLALLLLASCLSACTGEILDHPALAGGDAGGPPHFMPDAPQMPAPTETLDTLEGEASHDYLAYVAPALIGRTLRPSESSQLESQGGAAILPILAAWGDEPALARTARRMVETSIAASGGVDGEGVDFGMPGRIVEHVVTARLPWAQVLTHERCYAEDGSDTECDTGAPYTAGILTTRAFLSARRGRFNLSRAGTITNVFLCRNYPLAVGLEPPLARETLQPMFRALSAEEQTDPEAAMSGLANGFHCYACHGQFGAHAQLYVRFDVTGLWRADATGLQLEGGMPGESSDGLMASHLMPELAADEASQMLGQPVANLAEAAAALTSSDAFVTCAARHVLELALELDPARGVDDDLLREIAERAGAAPSFQDLLVAALTHPRVALTTARQLQAAERRGSAAP